MTTAILASTQMVVHTGITIGAKPKEMRLLPRPPMLGLSRCQIATQSMVRVVLS